MRPIRALDAWYIWFSYNPLQIQVEVLAQRHIPHRPPFLPLKRMPIPKYQTYFCSPPFSKFFTFNSCFVSHHSIPTQSHTFFLASHGIHRQWKAFIGCTASPDHNLYSMSRTLPSPALPGSFLFYSSLLDLSLYSCPWAIAVYPLYRILYISTSRDLSSRPKFRFFVTSPHSFMFSGSDIPTLSIQPHPLYRFSNSVTIIILCPPKLGALSPMEMNQQ